MDSQRENVPPFRPNPALKLMEQVREILRYYHYAYRTEQAYCQWIRRDIHHFDTQTHPSRLGAQDVERFLFHLASEGRIRILVRPGPVSQRELEDMMPP